MYGAGTRRTVDCSEAMFSADLEFGGKFGVPQLVTINKSASYGLQWNRIRDLLERRHSLVVFGTFGNEAHTAHVGAIIAVLSILVLF